MDSRQIWKSEARTGGGEAVQINRFGHDRELDQEVVSDEWEIHCITNHFDSQVFSFSSSKIIWSNNNLLRNVLTQKISARRIFLQHTTRNIKELILTNNYHDFGYFGNFHYWQRGASRICGKKQMLCLFPELQT